MAAPAKTGTGLQIIFSFFLGLMVTAFIGVGVYTFYPPPESKTQKQIEELNRQMEDIQGFKDSSAITDADRATLRGIQDRIRTLQDKQQAAMEVWGRNTSIILITFATIVMAVSLIRADQLPVISNGLLLGGVFTMVYGVGWIIATGTSIARFIVMTIALAITLTLGYVRFVRTREARVEQVVPQASGAAAAGGTGATLAVPTGDVDEVLRRLDALERRMDAAARALGERPGD